MLLTGGALLCGSGWSSSSDAFLGSFRRRFRLHEHPNRTGMSCGNDGPSLLQRGQWKGTSLLACWDRVCFLSFPVGGDEQWHLGGHSHMVDGTLFWRAARAFSTGLTRDWVLLGMAQGLCTLASFYYGLGTALLIGVWFLWTRPFSNPKGILAASPLGAAGSSSFLQHLRPPWGQEIRRLSFSGPRISTSNS